MGKFKKTKEQNDKKKKGSLSSLKENSNKKDKIKIQKKQDKNGRKLAGFYLDEEERKILEEVNKKTNISKSELVRKAIREMHERLEIVEE